MLKDLETQEKIVTQLLFLEDANIKEVARPTISNILPWDEAFQISGLIRTETFSYVDPIEKFPNRTPAGGKCVL